MKSNKLISYKENIFTKISNFFKKLFFRKKKATLKDIDEAPIYNKQQKEYFIENIVIKENEEEIRLKKLQLLYDNGEIDEDELSDEDIEKIVALYKKETEELNADTEIKKNHITQMLNELKQT